MRRGLCLLLATLAPSIVSPAVAAEADRAKNVIFLIPDGTSWEQFTLTRLFLGRPLATDAILSGAVMTSNYDSIITDSAAAGSAFATGVMTYTGAVAVHPGEERLATREPTPTEMQFRPAATLLEAARLSGRAVGTVVTATFTTATNAVFLSHTTARSAGPDIAEQGAHQGLDVFFGGGLRDFIPESVEEGRRTDGADLVAEMEARGVAIVRTRDEMMVLTEGPVKGFFAMHAMAPEVDRAVSGPTEPSLAEMTAKAIEILSQDADGFFLMVEGSQIDWVGHQNDIAHVLHDHVAFDDAVRVALDFANTDGRTLVVVAPDHNAGGLAIGNLSTYDALPLSHDDILGPIRNLDATAMYVWEELGIENDPTVPSVQRAVKEAWGVDFTDAQAAEVLRIAGREPRDEDYDGLGEVYARDFSHIGFVGHEHTGGDVPLFAFGPGAPSGLIAAPDLGRAIATAMGVDLDAASDRLFAPAEDVLAGMTVTVDRSNEAEIVLRAEGMGRTVEWPMNRNTFTVDGETVEVEGVAVWIDRNQKVWLPRAAAVALGTSGDPLPEINLAVR